MNKETKQIEEKAMDFTEKCVKKNYVYQGKIIKVRCDDAQLPDGNPCKREIIEHSGGACVLYVEGGKVLLVRQYRYAYGEDVYEIPAGKLEQGEDPALAAARELEEETGISPQRVELLYVIYPTPGYTNEKIYIYRAFDGVRTQSHLDEGEFVECVWVTIDEAEALMRTGKLLDAKTLIALQAYLLEQRK